DLVSPIVWGFPPPGGAPPGGCKPLLFGDGDAVGHHELQIIIVGFVGHELADGKAQVVVVGIGQVDVYRIVANDVVVLAHIDGELAKGRTEGVVLVARAAGDVVVVGEAEGAVAEGQNHLGQIRGVDLGRADRKSTRLNSSHVKI